MAFRVRHYPHNDLLNLAHYHREIIKQKVERGDHNGLALDCTSCLIALAFGVEALINFVGSRKVTGWNERESSPAKVRKVARALKIDLSETIEPFSAIATLREIRNGLAHGKPVRRDVTTQSGADLKVAMQAPWDAYCEPQIVESLYQQVIALRRRLFGAGAISWADSLTSAIGSN